MSTPTFRNQLSAATEKFVEEVVGMVQLAAKETILQALGVEGLGMGVPQLPMPNRRARRVGPSHAKGRATADLPDHLAKAYRRLKKSKRPITVVSTSKMLKMSESNARLVLGKLLSKKLVSTQRLGDGTARKVYLPR